MNDELRQLFKDAYEKAAERCYVCNHKCPLYVFITYINEKGYEQFEHELRNETLPEEVTSSLNIFFNMLKMKGIIQQIDKMDKDTLESAIITVGISC